jgi:hypothetical protein
MADYVIYPLDCNGEPLTGAHANCPSDDEALAAAIRTLPLMARAEVWLDDRCIGRVSGVICTASGAGHAAHP